MYAPFLSVLCSFFFGLVLAFSDVQTDLAECHRLFKQARFEEVTLKCQKIIQQDPQCLEACYLWVNSLVIQKKVSDAQKVYIDALEHNPDEIDLHLKYYDFLGRFFPNEAKQYVDSFPKKYYNHPALYYLMAKFKMRQNQEEDAVDH